MSFDLYNTTSLGNTGHPVNTDNFYPPPPPFSVRVKLQWEWVQVLWLVNGFLEYHPPIITNTCPPKRSQKSLRLKLVSILPRLSFWSGELDSACYDALEWCDHSTESYWAILLRGTVLVTENKFLSLVVKSFKCDHSNESFWAEISCATVCYAIESLAAFSHNTSNFKSTLQHFSRNCIRDILGIPWGLADF